MKSVLTASSFLFLMTGLSLKASEGKIPLLISSFESKTSQGGPVYNEITWFELPEKDVWMMNQSHHGIHAKAEAKDRLVIIVDKTQSPNTAYFMQIKPGPLVWSENLYQKKVNFRVSCFNCHSNGLRTIRPEEDSVEMKFADFARLNYLNFKIRAYGLLAEDSRHAQEDQSLAIPFRYRKGHINDTLKLKACASCHNGETRAVLTRQNAGTIEFLVKNKLMPPAPETLSAQDEKKIFRFINGF